MALPPRLEALREGIEQPRFVGLRFLKRRTAEKTGAQLRVPPDVVPGTHLILEEPRQQQTLRPGGFHQQPVVPRCRIRHEQIEDRAETRWRPKVDGWMCGNLGVVRKHARVVEQLLAVDGRLGHVLQPYKKELERPRMIDREQLTQRARQASPLDPLDKRRRHFIAHDHDSKDPIVAQQLGGSRPGCGDKSIVSPGGRHSR